MILLVSCKQNVKDDNSETLRFREKLEMLSDSIQIDKITIKNLFKSQILAHNGSNYDSLMIVEKVYKTHKELWDNCYAMIFGKENASKFNTSSGMIAQNKTLYPENEIFFNDRIEKLIELNLDSVVRANLTRFNELVPYKVSTTISILFTPLTGILFGACNNSQFCIELNYKEQDIVYTIEKGFLHELNYLAYEPLRENDLKKDTALRQTIDEGFVCYFTYFFLIKKYREMKQSKI